MTTAGSCAYHKREEKKVSGFILQGQVTPIKKTNLPSNTLGKYQTNMPCRDSWHSLLWKTSTQTTPVLVLVCQGPKSAAGIHVSLHAISLQESPVCSCCWPDTSPGRTTELLHLDNPVAHFCQSGQNNSKGGAPENTSLLSPELLSTFDFPRKSHHMAKPMGLSCSVRPDSPGLASTGLGLTS